MLGFLAAGRRGEDSLAREYLNVLATDWNHFLEIQEQLLFDVTRIVEASGTEISFQAPATIGRNRAISSSA